MAEQFSVILTTLLIGFGNLQVSDGYKMPTIVGGNLAVAGQFPWIVFIETPTEYTCVGTIVDSRHVLTSARCVLDPEGKLWNPFWFRITAGALDLYNIDPRVVFRRIIAIFVNENYSVLTKENDVAVLRVDQQFPSPHNTIEIAEFFPIATATNICQVAGWSPYMFNKQSVQQNFYGVRIRDWNVCNPTVQLNNVLCTQSVKKSNTCQGNSGGGLFCDRKLIGVFSYGTSCNDTVVPSVYTDVRMLKTWIESQFIRKDIPEPGSFPNEKL